MVEHPARKSTQGKCYTMDVRLAESINSFGPSPGANESVLEIPLADMQGLLSEMVSTYNAMVELVKDSGILRGRDLARLTTKAQDGLMAARSPIEKGVLLCAFTRQLLSRLKAHMKAQPRQAGKIIQVVSKIQARAVKIVDYIQARAEGRKEVALDSHEARTMLAGSGEHVSRKECIRAMRRAETLCPSLECNHKPGDGRQTMRLTGLAGEIAGLLDRISWQRSGLTA